MRAGEGGRHEWVELYRVIFETVSLLLLKVDCRAGRQLRGVDRRTAKIEDHATFILEAIKQQPDPTLAELREMLAERGVTTSIATLWRFFARHWITRKKRPATRRSRTVPTS
jgi:transposase